MSRRKKLINHTDILQYQIEAIARCIMPDILAITIRFTVEGTAASRVFFRVVAKAVRMGVIGLTLVSKDQRVR